MLKYLIVDDEERNLYLLEVLLRGHGYETIAAENGRECKMNPLLKNIPFIFSSAQYTRNKDEEFAMSLGVKLFIVKPQAPDA